jgi:hypothetical protein
MIHQGEEYSFKDLYKEIKDKAKDEGIQSDYEYLDLIDKVLEEKKNQKFFSEGEDLEQLKDDLEAMWPEIESELQE